MTIAIIIICLMIVVSFVAYAMIRVGKDEDRRNPYE